MDLRVIGPDQVRSLLPMDACIEVVDHAMSVASRRDALMPLRDKMALPAGDGLLGWMPGYMGDPPVFGAKLVGVFPGNHLHGMHSHHGVVVLFESEHGRPFAVVDAAEITAIRTAAASAVATRHLATEQASTLAILGYGTQARTHLESMLCVRPFTAVRVWGRRPDRALRFADELGPRFAGDIDVCADAREAVDGADVICTVTASPTPVLLGAWLEPGQHINAVGTSFPGIRELDTAAVVRSRLYVDLREGAIAHAGEFQLARDEGAIDERHILGEIGEVALGRVEGRTSPEQITLYKSLGLVVQDLAAAYHVWRKAEQQGVGATVPF